MNQYKGLSQRSCGGTAVGSVGGLRDRCSLSEHSSRADKKQGFGVYDRELAALYLPVQSFADIYDLETALCRGTLFRGLDKPFLGAKEGSCCGKQR